MTIIGITGPTGSGKTTLSEVVRDRGGFVIDCDKLYHEMLQSNTLLRQDIRDEFGDVFLPDGSLDRKKLGGIVFSDKFRLAALDRIVFYHIGTEVRNILQTARKEYKLIAIDAVNLLQSNLDDLCNITVGVLASVPVRLARIMSRDNISEEKALARIEAQKSDVYYRDYCSYIIENDELTAEQFRDAAEELVDLILKEHMVQ